MRARRYASGRARSPMRISVFGIGYVGAVACGCLARMGHEVVGVDVAEAKVTLLAAGR